MQENNPLAIELPEDIDDTIRILQLATGTVDGEAFWCYLAMYPTRYQDYAAKVAAGEGVDLGEYGEVLEQGRGEEPPQEIKEKMAREYGATPGFEQELQQMLRDAAGHKGE